MNNVFEYDFVVGLPTTTSTITCTNNSAGTTSGYNSAISSSALWITPEWPWGIHHHHWYPQYVWADEAFSKTKELFSSSGSSFPPLNAHQLKNGSLLLEFAFAGYKKEEIFLSFEGDTLILSSDGHERLDYASSRELKRGIKLSKFETKYQLAPEHFDTTKTKAKFEDGILSVTIPLSDSKIPKSIEIE